MPTNHPNTAQIIRLELHVNSPEPISRQEAAEMFANNIKGAALTVDRQGRTLHVEVLGGQVVHVSGINAGNF